MGEHKENGVKDILVTHLITGGMGWSQSLIECIAGARNDHQVNAT